VSASIQLNPVSCVPRELANTIIFIIIFFFIIIINRMQRISITCQAMRQLA